MDMPSRRVYNVGAHGGSINERMMSGIDLNGSLGMKKYDQHFDSHISNDHSIEHYSSRPHYADRGGVEAKELRESLNSLKRSETDHGGVKGNQVTFATHAS
jgi:hypothetical protein